MVFVYNIVGAAEVVATPSLTLKRMEREDCQKPTKSKLYNRHVERINFR